MSLEFDNHLAKLAAEQPGKQSTRRFRFSLRILFLLTTFAAISSYWTNSPTRTAKHFLRALNDQNYKEADGCFRAPEDRFLLELYKKHWRFRAWAVLEPWTIGQLFQGKRLVKLYVAYGDAGPMRSVAWTVIAEGPGLSTPEQFLGSGYSGGMVIASH